MLESAAFPGNPAAAAASNARNEDSGGGGSEERVKSEELDRNFGGNRWPREETLALLKIRSDMDVAFRDSSTKAPLWEEVSRKLGELGYHRNAKKCKEKFENIYKYHKRTKDGRSTRPNNKNYRFFEQLEALDNHPLLPPPSPEKIHPPMAALAVGVLDPANVHQSNIPGLIQNLAADFVDTSTSTTSSSSKEESDGMGMGVKKKRKLTDFFEMLMKSVVEKQEDLQRKFLEVMEKCEQDRIAREEAWKREEAARIEKERALLVQERSIAAAKDAAVLAFLQKFSEQASPVQMQWPEVQTPVENTTKERRESRDSDKNEERVDSSRNALSFGQMSSSRWPKEEVEALIRLRTNLDTAYHENAPKGPLWEEISAAMRKLGYDRNAKRCKEKWENINKYFKKVKESNRKRPGDSKTCPYFHQLDALYKAKTIRKGDNNLGNAGYDFKPEELLLHMMGGQDEQQQVESATEDQEHEDFGGKVQENEEEAYQMVTNE